MCEVRTLLDDLNKTFAKYRGQRRDELIDLISQVQCCECGHQMRLRNAVNMAASQKSTLTDADDDKPLNRLLIGCLIFLVIISLYWLHLARRYNYLKAYGNGACVTTFFYSYIDCEILI